MTTANLTTTPDSSSVAPSQVRADATCLGCGCVCDDVAVTVRNGQITAVAPDCALGRRWFLAPHPGAGGPIARIDGEPAGLEAALDRAAELLCAARSPLVGGLTESAVEAASLALTLADRLGATVAPAASAGRSGSRAAFVRSGLVSATLGEVRDRAETVLFWGHHPEATHPRHAERYSIGAQGRFVPGPRTVLVVDVGPEHAGAGTADRRIALPEAGQEAALGVVLALVRGVSLDSRRVAAATGVALADWQELADRLRAARWVAVFFGASTARLDPTGWDRLTALVKALHRDGRRAVGLPLGEAGNGDGAGAALTWGGGAPSALDLGAGWPEHRPGEATLADRLARGTVDAVLSLGPDPRADLPPSLQARLDALPVVRIDPGAARIDPSGKPPAVAIAVGRLGIEAGGTVARPDGLMLPLAPPLDPAAWPDERAVLSELLHRVRSISS